MAQYAEEYASSERKSGWPISDRVIEDIKFMVDTAFYFPENSVLEYRAGKFSVRKQTNENLNFTHFTYKDVANPINAGKTKNISLSDFSDDFICECGNHSSSYGLFPCDKNGNDMEPMSEWDYDYVCMQCGLIYQVTKRKR